MGAAGLGHHGAPKRRLLPALALLVLTIGLGLRTWSGGLHQRPPLAPLAPPPLPQPPLWMGGEWSAPLPADLLDRGVINEGDPAAAAALARKLLAGQKVTVGACAPGRRACRLRGGWRRVRCMPTTRVPCLRALPDRSSCNWCHRAFVMRGQQRKVSTHHDARHRQLAPTHPRPSQSRWAAA